GRRRMPHVTPRCRRCASSARTCARTCRSACASTWRTTRPPSAGRARSWARQSLASRTWPRRSTPRARRRPPRRPVPRRRPGPVVATPDLLERAVSAGGAPAEAAGDGLLLEPALRQVVTHHLEAQAGERDALTAPDATRIREALAFLSAQVLGDAEDADGPPAR